MECHKERLLIIGRVQFGYLTDSLKWVQYLRKQYEITYVCYDYGRRKFDVDGIKIDYVSYSGSKSLRGIRFLMNVIRHILTWNGKIFVIWFPYCGFLKTLMPWKRMGIDVRTLSILEDAKSRELENKRIISDVHKFDVVSVISNGIYDKIKAKHALILPLGADKISESIKEYVSSIRLVYIGTLRNRNIDKTIYGLKLFHDSHPEVSVEYDIIGGSDCPHDITILKKVISSVGMGDLIKYHGRKCYDELFYFLDKANVGVSFIPMTDYYDNQPPTKTFEYIFSGLVTLATATEENRSIINNTNGILIKDSIEGFADGLKEYWDNRERFRQREIEDSLLDFSWENICRKYLTRVIEKL